MHTISILFCNSNLSSLQPNFMNGCYLHFGVVYPSTSELFFDLTLFLAETMTL